jgi:hypothetical protein
MRKVSPLGLSITKILVGLLVAEAALFAAGKLVSRRQVVASPPREIGDWILSPGDPPISDFQRDSPRQNSVVYLNGDQAPVHVDFAAVQSLDGMRQPQKYMVDSDGRINPNKTRMLTYRKRYAYSISVIYGIDKNIITVHWCQRPGGNPVPSVTDSYSDALKAILSHRSRFYTCDVWVEARPTSGPETFELLEMFADKLSDKIRAGR